MHDGINGRPLTDNNFSLSCCCCFSWFWYSFFGGQDKVSDTSCGGVKPVTGDEYHEIEELTSWPLKQGCNIRFIVFQLFKEAFKALCFTILIGIILTNTLHIE